MAGLLRVSSDSEPHRVARSIQGETSKHGRITLRVIGAGALNQAIKAVAIARGYVAPGGTELVCVVSFIDLDVDGRERTAINVEVFAVPVGNLELLMKSR